MQADQAAKQDNARHLDLCFQACSHPCEEQLHIQCMHAQAKQQKRISHGDWTCASKPADRCLAITRRASAYFVLVNLRTGCVQVLIKRRKRGRGGVDSWEVVRARGHLDEVQELKSGEAAQALAQGRPSKESMQLVLTEGAVLGGGAFSRVSIVTGVLPWW